MVDKFSFVCGYTVCVKVKKQIFVIQTFIKNIQKVECSLFYLLVNAHLDYSHSVDVGL